MLYEMIEVGQWYLREDTQERFQVLDYDERAGTMRIQMFDGSLDDNFTLVDLPEPSNARRASQVSVACQVVRFW